MKPIVFRTLKTFEVVGRSVCHVVELDRDYENVDELVGTTILLDGTLRVVRGVERYAHAPPWRKGETVSLCLEGGTLPQIDSSQLGQ